MPRVCQKLGRYLILNEIARGGMATVYRGKLIGVEGFEKDVAIKKILPYWTHQQEFIDMLIDEAKILVYLQHKNIVQVFELGKESAGYFIAMEFVDGLDLKKLIKKAQGSGQKIPLSIVLYIIKEICLGLEFAHSRTNKKAEPLHIVHRDISPQNILISREGEVKITDFGIARVRGKTTETAAGVLKGKFSYMSPEQAIGLKVDVRTDVFALGVLTYELLTGHKCFNGSNDFETIEKVKSAIIKMPKNQPEMVLQLLQKSLSKDIDLRYQSVGEFRNTIELIETDLSMRATQNDLKIFFANLLADETKEPHEQTQPADQFAAEDVTLFKNETAITNCLEQAQTVVCLDKSHSHESISGVKGTETKIFDSTVLYDKTVVEVKPVLAPPIKTPVPKKPYRHSPFIMNANYYLSLLIIFFTVLFYFIYNGRPVNDSLALNHAESQTKRRTPDLQDFLTTAGTKTVSVSKRLHSISNLRASIFLQVVPSSARIETKIKGKTLALTGSWQYDFLYQDNPVHIPVRIYNEEYQDKESVLTITDQDLIHHKKIILEKTRYGSINVNVRPWGTVSVKGFGTKSVPAVFTVPVGRQLVSVYCPAQQKSISRYVDVKAEGAVYCRASFGSTNKTLYCQ